MNKIILKWRGSKFQGWFAVSIFYEYQYYALIVKNLTIVSRFKWEVYTENLSKPIEILEGVESSLDNAKEKCEKILCDEGYRFLSEKEMNLI